MLITRFVFYYRKTLELEERRGGVYIGSSRMNRVLDREAWELSVTGLNVQVFTNEEIIAKLLLLMLPLPLTFDHNNVCLWTDPLDFWRLLQFIAVWVVWSTALICAWVVKGEAREVNGASGMYYICGIYLDTVISCPVEELGKGLIGLFTLYKPPLHLRDGIPYHFAMKLCAVTNQLHLRQGRLGKTRWAPFTVSPAHKL